MALGTIFDEAPTLYARYRPAYPDAAVDALLELAGVPEGGAALEIGAGPGTLTLPLLDRGLRVTAIEPGPRMAAMLRARLDGRANARVVESTFEDAGVEGGAFDLVVSATAFHWVDPERRYGLAAAALRPGGALGLLRNDHVLAPESEAYYRGVRPFYEREFPDDAPYIPPVEADLDGLGAEMDESEWFDVVDERRFARNVRRTTAELIGLLRTYSPHRALPPRRRARLFASIKAFVDDELGGSFTDRMVTTVSGGRVRAGSDA